MSEHVACGESLQEAVVIAAIPFADLAVHLQKTPLHLPHHSWHSAVCRFFKFWGAEQVAAVCQFAHSYAAWLFGKKCCADNMELASLF